MIAQILGTLLFTTNCSLIQNIYNALPLRCMSDSEVTQARFLTPTFSIHTIDKRPWNFRKQMLFSHKYNTNI